MTNEELVQLLTTDVPAFNAYRKEHPDAKIDLNRVKLSGAQLSGADLTNTNLSGADLTRTNLLGANLTEAILSEARLIKADLFHANLSWAKLSRAKLCCANLSGADLESIHSLETATVVGVNWFGVRNANQSTREIIRRSVEAMLACIDRDAVE